MLKDLVQRPHWFIKFQNSCGARVGGSHHTKKREPPPITSIATGEIEAKIIQIASSPALVGKSRWMLVMIEQEIVKLGITISDNT